MTRFNLQLGDPTQPPAAWRAKVFVALVALLPAALLARLPAQDPADPFGNAKPANAKTAEPVTPLAQEPLVIRQIRESNPTSAEALLQAAEAVYRFGRPDECKRYLAKFVALRADDAVLAPLLRRFGDKLMLEFTQDPKLQPEGAQTAEKLLQAARRVAVDPARIDNALKQLGSDNAITLSLAVTQLEEAGVAAVAPALRVLADAGRADEHPRIRTALLELKTIAEEPLLSALAAPEPLRIAAMTALARMKSRRALPLLLGSALAEDSSTAVKETARRAAEHILGGPLPGVVSVQNFLQREFDRVRGGQHAFKPNADDQVAIFLWDEKSGAPAQHTLELQDAIRQESSRLADEISRLAPDRVDLLRSRLLYAFDFWQSKAGLDYPLTAASPPAALAERLGPAEVARVLEEAMQRRLTPAAIAAVAFLSRSNDLSLLVGEPTRPSPLLAALTHSDARIRVAAALAVLKLKPSELFSGQSLVVDALTGAIRTSGRSRVLVADSRASTGQSLVGMCESLGFSGREATSGREAFRLATQDPDLDAILISEAIDFPQVEELAQLFRGDHRTAKIPIAILIGADQIADLRGVLGDPNLTPNFTQLRERMLERVQSCFVDDRLTYVSAHVHNEETLAPVLAQLRKRAGRSRIDPEFRLRQAQAALVALGELARTPATFSRYDLILAEPTVIEALTTPGLTSLSAAFLAESASPKAQTALVQLAGEPARPLPDRSAAIAAFEAAVKKRGLLLTQKQILAEYDRYNAGANLPAESLAILGRLLDVMESAPALAAARNR